MIVFKSNVKISSIDSSYSENGDLILKLYFNAGNTLISPKAILDFIYMLNGRFTYENIINRNIGHTDIDSKNVLDELLCWGIIYELPIDFNEKYVNAKNKLNNHIVHFPKISNINIMIAVLLHKIHVKTIFYDNGIVAKNDIDRNIYYKCGDIGKNIITFVQDEMKIDTVCFADSDFNVDKLNNSIDIIVNSDVNDWINNENFITINTWNYKNTHFNGSNLFNDKINVSDNLKTLIEGYILAIRAVDDMLYSVIGNLAF